MNDFIMEYFGYKECIALSNNTGCRVVLCPEAGGRVLEYSLNGVNVIYLNPAQKGWRHEPGAPADDPCGGRFDVGPEWTIPPHTDLWLGDWRGETTGEGRARLTSQRDRLSGLKVTRSFALTPDSPRLRVEQRVFNDSARQVVCCHWSRTLATGGGIALIPLSPCSRFPRHYIRFGPGPVINFRPEDPNIRVREGFLEILGTPRQPKLGMDSAEGWFSYLTRSGLLFTKRYTVAPDRVYGEVASLTISIWYYKDEMCELEPIGPLERLSPGESFSFSEEWELHPWRYPAPGEKVDLEELSAQL
ncbi:MAG: hypothetical protein PHV28_14910 [Kiritimatiellae bacterium]|nr:hypothetical protein [Kiritimatiellia bacterium]